jgi:hypothetical protein
MDERWAGVAGRAVLVGLWCCLLLCCRGGGGDGGGGAFRRGYVLVSELDVGGFQSNTAAAGFVRARAAGQECGATRARYGDCYTIDVEQPICDPACTGGEECFWADNCLAAECRDPATMLLSAGVITISGASHQPTITCMPVDGGYDCDLDTSADLLEPGDELAISAPGDTFPAFSGTIGAPSDLVATTDTSGWTLASFTSGMDQLVEWETPAGADQVGVTVASDYVTLFCETENDGAFAIPSDGIEAIGDASSYFVSVSPLARITLDEGADGEVVMSALASGLVLAL